MVGKDGGWWEKVEDGVERLSRMEEERRQNVESGRRKKIKDGGGGR